MTHHQMAFMLLHSSFRQTLLSVVVAWRGDSMVGRRIRDRKVAGSTPGLCATT